MHPKNEGIFRFVRATLYSAKGLKAAIKSESAVRQELLLMTLLLPIAIWIDVSLAEKLILIITLFLVLITELLNTAVETAVDRVSFDLHELSGKAKDIGSAAVFISILLMLICWVTVLLSHYA